MKLEDANYALEPELTEDELLAETTYVRVSETIIHPSDITVNDMMNAIEASGSLDFWADPEEEKYSEQDGDDV